MDLTGCSLHQSINIDRHWQHLHLDSYTSQLTPNMLHRITEMGITNMTYSFKYKHQMFSNMWRMLRAPSVDHASEKINDADCVLIKCEIMEPQTWCSEGVDFLVRLKNILNERILDGQHLRKFFLELAGIKLIVTAGCNNHLGLLLQSEVLVGEIGIHILFVHLKDFIVAHNTRVCKVPNTSQIAFAHLNRYRQKLIQNGHGVRDVHHLLIPSDLGYEVAGSCKVPCDGHPYTQCTHIIKFLQELLHLPRWTSASYILHTTYSNQRSVCNINWRKTEPSAWILRREECSSLP